MAEATRLAAAIARPSQLPHRDGLARAFHLARAMDVALDVPPTPSSQSWPSTRARFALTGLVFALAASLGAPVLSRVLSLPIEVALGAVLTVVFVVLGWVLGARMDALEALPASTRARSCTSRRWEERAEAEIVRAATSRMPISLLVVRLDDVDPQRLGSASAAAEQARVSVAEALIETSRTRDVPARLSVDELALLLPRTRANEAVVVAERLRRNLRARRNAEPAAHATPTISIGIAELDVARAPTPTALVEAARQALAAARRRGRDRLEVARRAPRLSQVIVLADRRRSRHRKSP